jgi:D-methionine transport system ATP-binding protein
MIELKHITKIFRQGDRITTALSDVSLSVPEGKIMGVIGESGAGKSTLIRCVNLLERPTSGEVSVGGQDLMNLTPSELTKARRNIGMIFQHFNLLSSRTVFDNIAFPLELDKTPKTEIKKRVTELLKLVGLENKSHEYPSKLSGGQKQRVAIARTLACNPKVLLCDEATSALDPATTHSILSLLKEINHRMNITILLITHEMEVVKDICDEVAVISGGKLIEQGSISEIFSHPRNALTKQFVESSIRLQIPLDYMEKLSPQPLSGKSLLITLEISGESMANAALSEVARLFQTNSNIVCAQMDYAGGVKFGMMLIELIGEIDKELEAVAFFKDKNIKVEVLGYV